MLVDSHCHLDRLDLAPFQGRLADALQAAAEQGVKQLLSVSITLEDWPTMVRGVEAFANVSVSVGVHPSAAGYRPPTEAELLQCAQHSKVVAIGETGLDYHYGKDRQARQRQQDWLRIQIAAARACRKPLIIHTRSAWQDTRRILQEEHADRVGGVIHCFSEDWKAAKEALDLNFYISFSGIVTFSNALAIQEVARRMPAGRMLVETDSPYLAPQPRRGKSNQPAWVRYTAQAIAELRGESLEQVAEATTSNYFQLFGRGAGGIAA